MLRPRTAKKQRSEPPIAGRAIIIVQPFVIAPVARPVRLVQAQHRGLLQLLARQVHDIAVPFGIVVQQVPGQRVDGRSDSQKPAERKHGIGHLAGRSEEHTSELQSLMRISYAVFCLKKKTTKTQTMAKLAQKEHTSTQDTTFSPRP